MQHEQIVIYVCCLLFLLVIIYSVLKDYISLRLFENKCYFYLSRKRLNGKERRRLSRDPDYLLQKLDCLNGKKLRSLKMLVKREVDDTFSSKIFNGLLSFSAIFVAIFTLVSTFFPDSGDATLTQNLLEDLGRYFFYFILLISAYIISYSFSAYFEKLKNCFVTHFITVIEESELNIPLNTRLAGDEYPAQSTSANRQQSVPQYDHLESHEPIE